ncbi:hypothetical protein BC628DRAFT_821393 [Trametes gibbosa]|nr:hypothetical protein BC628DRAFT_821393 [Trametes gibbosa]
MPEKTNQSHSSMVQTDSQQQPNKAPAVFDQPSADLILRTSDLVDFRVHSQILAQASSFFASMLALPQPAAPSASSSVEVQGSVKTDPPVVPVSEDSATFELLLRLVYPITKHHVQLDDPSRLVPALQAATKYEMELPLEIMSQRLSLIAREKPVQVWAAACRADLEDVAREAAGALRSLACARPHKVEALGFVDELGDMSGISAGEYFRLKQYLMDQPTHAAPESLKLLSPPPSIDLGARLKKKKKKLSLGITAVEWFSTDIPGTDAECWPSSRRGPTTPFAAHQSVLASNSPIWKAHFASLREASASTGSQPIALQLDEDPETLSALLQACYTQKLPDDLESQIRLLSAAQKYEIAHMVAQLNIRLAGNDVAVREPLHAYFVAVNHGLRDHAKTAAKNVLVKQTAHTYTLIMEHSPALAYHRLLLYYDTCRAMIRDRALEAIGRLPTSIQHGQYGYTAHAGTIKTTWARAVDEATFGSPEDVRQTLQKTFLPQYGAPGVEGYVGAILHCVLATQEETERALNEVEINLG